MARRPSITSASRVRRKSRQIQNATIGTHVSPRGVSDPKRGGAGPAGFSSPRKSARAKRGFVEQVGAKTTTAESTSAYARRVNRMDYTLSVQRKARVRGIVTALVVLVLVVAVAGGIGSFVYMGSVSDKMALGDADAKAALVAPKEGEPSYTLLAGEFYEPGQNYQGPDLLLLLRVDAASKQASVLAIPPNLTTELSDGKTHWISEAQTLGGDAALIKAVASVTDTPISHYVKTDAAQFVKLVDSLGGVTVNVTEEVDDPAAGDIYIPAGTQTLKGQEALTFCRATNYAGGVEKRTANQFSFARALADKLLDSGGLGTVFTLDGVAGNIKTDLSAGDAISLIDTLRSIPDASIQVAQVPGYSTINTASGVRSFSLASNSWNTLRTTFKQGGDLAGLTTKAADVDPGSFTVTVRNGSGVTGGAVQVGDILTGSGFKVAETGNADSFVYDETLVVYNSDDKEAAAQTVVDKLGIGRAVESGGFYAFSTDVLVMVGKDWKPLN